MTPLILKIEASYNQSVTALWREELIELLGAKPRRLSRWCELGLLGSMSCIKSAESARLTDNLDIRLYTEHGTLNATAEALGQVQSYLPMPFTFMQTQPGQFFNALGAATGWCGDGVTCVYADRYRGEVMQLRGLTKPTLLGWVDDHSELISRWIWLRPATDAEFCIANAAPDLSPISSLYDVHPQADWLKIDPVEGLVYAGSVG